VSDSTPPQRLLDPDAPTPPRLRALLAALRPRDPSDEADARIEARLFESLIEEGTPPAPSIPRRAAG
jgi:hypothetical protein